VTRLPDRPGVYLFLDGARVVLYVGKAVSLRKRVATYFRPSKNLPPRVARMTRHIADLQVRETSSETEALLLEAQLIKAHRPKYNVALRDDKSYPMLKITRETFPRLQVVRRRQPDGAAYFGPYADVGLMHEAVRFLRRVFPLRTCATFPKSPCLEYHLGQCLAPCVGYIDEARYGNIVEDLAAFLRGGREDLLRDLSKRMAAASRERRYEEAARLRDQIDALTSVIAAKEKAMAAGPLEQLQAALRLPVRPRRIEAFDISNIFGQFAVGSLVVFTDGKPHRAQYRRFRIETVQGSDDCAMMREVICRRYSGSLSATLPRPDLVLVDGGKGQLQAACETLQRLSVAIPAMGLAKRFEHIFLPDTEEPIVLLPTSPVLHLVQHVRDEAHRVAVTYHRRLRGRTTSASLLREVPGIGPQRAKRLLAQCGSVARLRRMSADDIADAAGLSRTLAEALCRHIGGPAARTLNLSKRRRHV